MTWWWPTSWRTSSSAWPGQVRPFLKEDGLFLCSGIIDDRAEEVARHLQEAGWDILRTRQSEGWFSYLCR